MQSITRSVEVRLDEESDAAYISFPGFEDDTFPTQIIVEDDRLTQLGVDVILDLTADGRMAGIEVLGATILLDNRMLSQAR